MIIKWNFNPTKVVHYVKMELLISTVVSVGIWWMYENGIAQVSLPFSIAAILGSALAIFIAFRNNSAYGRWWEARTVWGGIVNSSRVLARLVITFTDSHANQANYEKERSEGFKKHLIYSCIAWVHALRIHLRNQETWSELKPFLTSEDYRQLIQSQNKPNFIQLLMGQKIYQGMANGTLGGFDSFQMEGQLLALANYQGSCERIKNTPLLRQYDFFTRLFLYAFIFLMPFALISDFSRMEMASLMIPVSILISFVFSIQAKVGEVNEDPFENRITDVPLSALCNTIEGDLREMLGEKELPQKTEVKKGYLF